MLGLGMLFGFIRGLRKSVYHFLVKLLFYVIFFATLGIAVRFLWSANFNFISNVFGMLNIAGLSDATSFKEALPIILESMFGDTINADLNNENFLAFAEGVGLFILKIVYAIIYFTVIQLLYRFVSFIVYIIFFKQSKEHVEAHGKKRMPGMAVGLMSGLLAVYATLVILGGMMDVSDNLLKFLDASENAQATVESRFDESENTAMSLSTSPVPMETLPVQTQEEEAIQSIREVTEGYKNNVVVKNLTRLKLTDDDTGRETKLNLYFFDRIFSIDYETDDISGSVALRHELAVFTDATSIFMDSEFSESQDLSDVTGSEIENLFNQIANSDLLVALVPIALDMGQDHYDVELNVEKDALYAIDYKSELQKIGAIASSAFSLINTAGLLDDNPDYDSITLDGDTTKSIFDDLGDSELATLAAYVAMEPMLEQALGESNTVITVPENIVWEDEFAAFGEVAREILDTNITLGDIQSQDPLIYVDRLSNMDLTVLLNSRIVEQAMVNVFTGEAGIEGMDMLVAHDDIQWRDTYDGDVRTDGELRIMLDALNTLGSDAALDDLEAFNVNIILDISESTLDALFTSEVLGDTLGNFIVDMAEDPLVIPSTTLKTITVDAQAKEVVKAEEIKNIFKAVQDLGVEDLTTLEFDPLLLKNFSMDDDDTVLDETKTQNMFDSEILHATLSDVLLDLTTGTNAVITVPETDIDSGQILLDHSTDPIQLISTDELNALLDAFLALDINDFDTLESIDLTVIKNDFNRLLESAIIHATFSDQLLALSDDGTLVVPYYDQTDTLQIRQTVSNTEFVVKEELESVVTALDVLDLLDFQSFDGTVDLTLLYDETNRNTLLESSILQATISDQALNLESDLLDVPFKDASDNDVRITANAGAEPTEYITKAEIHSMIKSMEILNITDISSYDGTFNLSSLSATAAQDTLLSSASIHATFSDEITGLSNEVLIVPEYKEDGTSEIRFSNANSREYVSKSEIKALIDALIEMGYTNLDSFDTSIDSGEFFASRETLLLSSSIQATLSDKLINDTGAILLVPDEDINATPIRLQSDTYIKNTELSALLDGLELLGLTDFDSLSFTSTDVLGVDFNTLLESASLQLTISDTILSSAKDDQASATVGDLIIPLAFQETVPVESVNTSQIESDELLDLLVGLETLGISDFDGSVSESTVTTMDQATLSTLLESGSIHVTVDHMIDSNAAITIPDYPDASAYDYDAVHDTLHGISEITTKNEILAFVEAVNTLASGDVTDVTFDFSTIYGMNDTQQAIIFNSMIARNTLTPEIESAFDALPGQSPDANWYHDSDTSTYFTLSGMESAVDTLESLGY